MRRILVISAEVTALGFSNITRAGSRWIGVDYAYKGDLGSIGNDVELAVVGVPEPSAAVAFAAGLLLTGCRKFTFPRPIRLLTSHSSNNVHSDRSIAR